MSATRLLPAAAFHVTTSAISARFRCQPFADDLPLVALDKSVPLTLVQRPCDHIRAVALYLFGLLVCQLKCVAQLINHRAASSNGLLATGSVSIAWHGRNSADAYVLLEGTASLSADAEARLRWATVIGGRCAMSFNTMRRAAARAAS